MPRLKKAEGFKIQTRADAVPEEFRHLPAYVIGYTGTRKKNEMVLVPKTAYRFKIDGLGWKQPPRLVIYKNYYWTVADYETGLDLPKCFGKTREDAIAATIKTLNRVGEDRFWQLQVENMQLLKEAGVKPNGFSEKLKPVAIPDFTATQLSLL